MTLPDERYRAVRATREFLVDLLDPKKTPKVPRAIRDRAGRCLRHYPWEMYMEIAAEKAPTIFKVGK